MDLQAASCSSRSMSRFVRPAAAGSRRLVVRAAADNLVPAAKSGQPPVLVWPQDNETARDVFAFAGSLPEVRQRCQSLCTSLCTGISRLSKAIGTASGKATMRRGMQAMNDSKSTPYCQQAAGCHGCIACPLYLDSIAVAHSCGLPTPQQVLYHATPGTLLSRTGAACRQVFTEYSV